MRVSKPASFRGAPLKSTLSPAAEIAALLPAEALESDCLIDQMAELLDSEAWRRLIDDEVSSGCLVPCGICSSVFNTCLQQIGPVAFTVMDTDYVDHGTNLMEVHTHRESVQQLLKTTEADFKNRLEKSSLALEYAEM